MTTDGAPDRPVRLSPPARREQVLDLAQDLFARQGFHHVAMDDIADRAEVSKPVLYRHFPGKLDLYLAVVDRLGVRLVAALDQRLGPDPDLPQLAAALAGTYVAFVEDVGGAYGLLLESDVTHDDRVRARVETSSTVITRRAAEVIARRADLASAPATLVAAAVTGAAAAAAVARHRSDDVDVATTTALLTALLTEGLAAFAPDSA